MKFKLKKRAIVLILAFVVLVWTGIYLLTRPLIVFNEKVQEIEINSEYDPMSFISEVREYKKKDVIVDSSKVDIGKLGEYKIKYTVGDESYNLKVKVVDTVSPDFDLVEIIDTDASGSLTAEELVSNIQDQTKTKVYFAKNYDLTKEGTIEAKITVEDEGKNKTTKTCQINVHKDKKAPELIGVKDYHIFINGEIDYLKGISASDDYDPQPVIEYDDSKVDLSKEGTYTITFTVSDRSKNKQEYKQKVIVSVQPKINEQTERKVVNLTFDDGPSANTEKILDILDKYDAKATFFVTGANQKYNYLIKEAHDRGHTIALHTYSHDYAKVYASVDAYFNDLNQVGEMVKEQIGYVPKYIRFPGGSSNTVSRKYCPGIMTTLSQEVQNRGYQYYDWNASSYDASANTPPVSTIVSYSTSSSKNNINLLFHDSQPKTTTVEALPTIIEHYKNLGYSFEAIDDTSFIPHQTVAN